MSSWGFEEVDNALNSWSSLSQFDDMVWDDFGESGDHIVPEPNSPTENGWPQNADRRKRLHRDPFSPAPKAIGQVSQRHGGAHKGGKEESMSGVAPQLHELDEATLENGDWNTGAGSSVVNNEEASTQPSSRTVAKEEPSAGLLSEDMQLYMENPGFPSDEGSLLDPACPFPLPDVGPTDDMDLFVAGSEADKGGNLLDYSWDSIDNLDDVDKLFRNNDSSFGQGLSNTTEAMQWTASPARLQQSAGPTSDGGPASSLEHGAVKGTMGTCEGKMDFVPCNDILTLPKKETSPIGPALGDASLRINTQFQQHPHQHDTAHSEQETHPACNEEDEKMSEAGSHADQPVGATLKANDNTEEEAGPSSLSTAEPDKAGLAQAHRARRHAANRKRSEERLRRQFPPRKLAQSPLHVVPHGPEVPGQKGLQVRLPAQVSHLQPGALHGYAPASLVSDPHIQSSPRGPYIHAGYGPHYHHVPMLVNGSSSTPQQIHPSQQVYVGYQQVGPHPPKPPLDQSHLAQLEQFEQQKQLRQHLDVPLRPPPPSSPAMTPQEKLEKLRWRQQMQARLAVQQQQQQLAQQVGLEQIRKQQLVQSNNQQQQIQLQQGSLQPLVDQQELKAAGRSGEAEDSVMLSQDVSAGTSTAQEEDDDSLEAVVLRQLETTMLMLDINTRMCIRDALFRLARSAMQRRAAGDSGSSSASSEGHDRVPGGVESSSGSNLPSSNRASRMGSINLETETNPIDRSIANLLFHKRVPHPPPVSYYGPVPGDGTPYSLGPPTPPGVATQWGWKPPLAPGNFVGSLPSPSTSGPSMTSTHDTGGSGPGISAAQSPGVSSLMFDPRLSSPRPSVKILGSTTASGSQGGNFHSPRGQMCELSEVGSAERPDIGGVTPIARRQANDRIDTSSDKLAQQATRSMKAETDSATSPIDPASQTSGP